MIEDNQNIKNEIFEALPIPDDSVILKTKKFLDLSQLALLGIKEIIRQRGINLKIKKKKDTTELDCIFEINNFSIQVIFAGFSSDQIIVPLNRWFKINNAPQIILAANIDEESNIVSFKGILTAKEFINIYLKKNTKGQSFEIPLGEFKGGINRLLSFVQILDSKALTRNGLSKNLSNKVSFFEKLGLSKTKISIGAIVLGSIIFGPTILKPRISYDLASIELGQVAIPSKTRAINEVNNIYPKLCILSPFVDSSQNIQKKVTAVSFDKPIIYSPDPINEIIISKNGEVIWKKKGLSINERIKGPIPWPINPIKSKEEYLLSIRPKGLPSGEFAKILINSGSEVIKFDDLVDSLGNNKNKWIKTINLSLKTDKNLAFALLLSEKLPDNNSLKEAKNKLLSIEGCIK
jgi:hypothetical protein